VLLTGRTPGKVEAVAGEIVVGAGQALCLEALAGDRRAAEQTVAQAISAWGRLDNFRKQD